ncbi:t121.3 [Tupaiid betaherpesvirus 1]|uniref:T121.3 n=1 Tax=Tupaiid herpesvirus 1 (strain 1) TaxID=10397 RepID=Q91TH7_TUHV1|nr:t121.3 [Tupaiid betaherpesvirus 1]AAK57170.1 t121.3 [Tupaiid betaherpesvirus 1]
MSGATGLPRGDGPMVCQLDLFRLDPQRRAADDAARRPQHLPLQSVHERLGRPLAAVAASRTVLLRLRVLRRSRDRRGVRGAAAAVAAFAPPLAATSDRRRRPPAPRRVLERVRARRVPDDGHGDRDRGERALRLRSSEMASGGWLLLCGLMCAAGPGVRAFPCRYLWAAPPMNTTLTWTDGTPWQSIVCTFRDGYYERPIARIVAADAAAAGRRSDVPAASAAPAAPSAAPIRNETSPGFRAWVSETGPRDSSAVRVTVETDVTRVTYLGVLACRARLADNRTRTARADWQLSRVSARLTYLPDDRLIVTCTFPSRSTGGWVDWKERGAHGYRRIATVFPFGACVPTLRHQRVWGRFEHTYDGYRTATLVIPRFSQRLFMSAVGCAFRGDEGPVRYQELPLLPPPRFGENVTIGPGPVLEVYPEQSCHDTEWGTTWDPQPMPDHDPLDWAEYRLAVDDLADFVALAVSVTVAFFLLAVLVLSRQERTRLFLGYRRLRNPTI